MAVAVDATGTLKDSTTNVTSLSYTNITVGSGSNRGLILFLCINGGGSAPTGVTATWDSGVTNQAMTQRVTVANASNNSNLYVFALRNPVSGAKTLAISWTNTANVSACAISFTGVDQTSDAIAFPNTNSATGNGTSASVVITSATGTIPVALGVCIGTSTLAAANQTQIYIDTAVVADNGGQRATGAASVTFSWSVTSAGNWAAAGLNVAAAAAATLVTGWQNTDAAVFFKKKILNAEPPAFVSNFQSTSSISGMAWYEPLDIPVYGKPLRDFIAPAFVEPAAVSVGISGNAWFEPLDIPVYGKPLRDFITPSFTSQFTVAGISGNAWFVREDTYKRKPPPFDYPFAHDGAQFSANVGISGNAWFEPLDIPVYGKPLRDFIAPAYTTPTQPPHITASFNVSDTIWLRDPPEVIPPTIERPIVQQTVGISGNAWYGLFDIPVYGKPSRDFVPAAAATNPGLISVKTSFNVSDTIWLPDPPESPPFAFSLSTPLVPIQGIVWFSPWDFAKTRIVNYTPPPAWDPQFFPIFVTAAFNVSDTIWLPDPPLSPPSAWLYFTPTVVWDYLVSDIVVLPDPLLTIAPAWDPKFTFQQTVGISGMSWFEPPDFAKGLVINYTPPPSWDPQFVTQIVVPNDRIVKFIGNVGHFMIR
jgi:hypothetical protein